MLYAGMDVHKKFSGYSMSKEGEVVRKGRIKTNEKEITNLITSMDVLHFVTIIPKISQVSTFIAAHI